MAYSALVKPRSRRRAVRIFIQSIPTLDASAHLRFSSSGSRALTKRADSSGVSHTCQDSPPALSPARPDALHAQNECWTSAQGSCPAYLDLQVSPIPAAVHRVRNAPPANYLAYANAQTQRGQPVLLLFLHLYPGALTRDNFHRAWFGRDGIGLGVGEWRVLKFGAEQRVAVFREQ